MIDLLTSRAQRARGTGLYLAQKREARLLELERASESSTCFPCWKSNQVTLFWRELFRVGSRRKVSIITFPVSYNGSKAMLFCAHTEEKITPTKPFFMFLQFQKIFPYNVMGLQRTPPNEGGYFQDRLNYLKPKHVKIRSFYLTICSKWERNCLTKLCSTQRNFAKTNQTVKPNLQGSLCVKRLTRHEHKRNRKRGSCRHQIKHILSTTVTFDYFALMFADIPVLYCLQPIRDCVVNERIISTRNLEVLVRRSIREL